MTTLTGGAVQYAKEFIDDKLYKEKVTSTLIYGVQWDTTLKFFNDEAYLKNSTEKGHYSTRILTKTGSNENYKIKNIYDMAGNAWEWTMEAYENNTRVIRGGIVTDRDGSYDSASSRCHNGPIYTNSEDGFRIALYLQI